TFADTDIKKQFIHDGPENTLADALVNADVFIGLSAAKAVSAEMIGGMKSNPIIFALANPEPEIHPDIVSQVRPDAIMATGRSDFPNQINNAICFPYLFRGALDVRATAINEAMKIAAVHAIAKIAQSEATDIVANAYGGKHHIFGIDYIIPKPFDKRLYTELPIAVAKAAMESGVARQPITDFKKYAKDLEDFAHDSSQVMRPLMEMIEDHESAPARIAFAEGEEIRILQAVQEMVDKKACKPILIGRPEVILQRIQNISLRLKEGRDFTIVNPEHDPRYDQYWAAYHGIMERSGVTVAAAKNTLRTNFTVIAAMMIVLHDADAMICGSIGQYQFHKEHIQQVLGLKPSISQYCALNVLSMESGPLFIADPLAATPPTVQTMLDMTGLAISCVRDFQIEPRVAFVSRSNFGSVNHESALMMRSVVEQAKLKYPDIEIDGEMHADVALLPHLREKSMPHSTLKGAANLLIMPNIDAAHISYSLLKTLTQANTIGPILLGVNASAHIATQTASVRDIVNISMLAAAQVKVKN
ncbi:MAG: phosphate acyltransferase, partial [Alphaproteobacteria bacterium]|nr:phosphate acyltransferase [Alphaproteobacteria bacterium]